MKIIKIGFSKIVAKIGVYGSLPAGISSMLLILGFMAISMPATATSLITLAPEQMRGLWKDRNNVANVAFKRQAFTESLAHMNHFLKLLHVAGSLHFSVEVMFVAGLVDVHPAQLPEIVFEYIFAKMECNGKEGKCVHPEAFLNHPDNQWSQVMKDSYDVSVLRQQADRPELQEISAELEKYSRFLRATKKVEIFERYFKSLGIDWKEPKEAMWFHWTNHLDQRAFAQHRPKAAE